jgi:hypothetical protein
MISSRRHFLRSAAASSILFPGIMNQLLADDGEGYLNSVSPLQTELFLAIANKVIDQVLAYDGHSRENLPFIIAGKGGGSIKTGRFLPDIKGNQGDLLNTLLSCAGVSVDRPVGIATKQIDEIKA